MKISSAKSLYILICCRDLGFFLYNLTGMLINICDTCTLKYGNQAQSNTRFQLFSSGQYLEADRYFVLNFTNVDRIFQHV